MLKQFRVLKERENQHFKIGSLPFFFKDGSWKKTYCRFIFLLLLLRANDARISWKQEQEAGGGVKNDMC